MLRLFMTLLSIVAVTTIGCVHDGALGGPSGASGSGPSGSSGSSGPSGAPSGASGGGTAGTDFTEPVPAPICGDGMLHIYEQCDDGDATSGDGCSSACKLEDNWKCEGQCDPVGKYECNNSAAVCSPTICGDHRIEGTESCDEGVPADRDRPFDGCYRCEKEPCVRGVCSDVCGDGVVIIGSALQEECDDGNLRNGDGCTKDCTLEEGHTCHLVESELPDSLSLPLIIRDMQSNAWNDNQSVKTHSGHPDFNPEPYVNSVVQGIPASTLDANGKPTMSASPPSASLGAIPSGFSAWYNDSPTQPPTSDNVSGNWVIITEKLLFKRDPNAPSRYTHSVGGYFPANAKGWVSAGWEPALDSPFNRNFGFTSEFRYVFVYSGDEVLKFLGDDDLFVFVNGKLCVDLGGIHGREGAIMNFANPDADARQASLVKSCKTALQAGHLYELAVFGAERHVNQSNFDLTLEGFVTATSDCSPFCGDGVQTAPEQCDDGLINGTVDSNCSKDCRVRVN